MTFLDSVLREDPPDYRKPWAEARQRLAVGLAWLLYAAGWMTAKALRIVATAVAAVLYGVGWIGARLVWPALCWSGRIVRNGWEDGRKPIGGQRGAA